MELTTLAPVVLAVAVLVLFATLWAGLRRRDAAIAANAVASLGAVALPAVVSTVATGLFGAEITFGPGLTTWIAIAGVLHMFGMLGWYDSIWWWDHLTHGVSGALVAAVVYAWVVVVGPEALPGPLGWSTAGVATVVLTVLAGVFWEALEWAARLLSDRVGVERVLKHYGRFDTPLDLVFDVVGALVVVTVDVRVFVPTFETVPGLSRTLLTGAIAVFTVGTIASVLLVGYGRRAW